jgi:hypothetical protein
LVTQGEKTVRFGASACDPELPGLVRDLSQCAKKEVDALQLHETPNKDQANRLAIGTAALLLRSAAIHKVCVREDAGALEAGRTEPAWGVGTNTENEVDPAPIPGEIQRGLEKPENDQTTLLSTGLRHHANPHARTGCSLKCGVDTWVCADAAKYVYAVPIG